jgi:hypothetical protein
VVLILPIPTAFSPFPVVINRSPQERFWTPNPNQYPTVTISFSGGFVSTQPSTFDAASARHHASSSGTTLMFFFLISYLDRVVTVCKFKSVKELTGHFFQRSNDPGVFPVMCYRGSRLRGLILTQVRHGVHSLIHPLIHLSNITLQQISQPSVKCKSICPKFTKWNAGKIYSTTWFSYSA